MSQPRLQAGSGLFADQALAQPTVGIDDVGDRQHVVARQLQTRGGILRQHGEANSEGLGSLAQRLALQGIEVDPEHPRPLALQRHSKPIQLGDLGAARLAPLGPVIDHQPLAFELLSRYLSSMLIDAPVLGATGQKKPGNDTNHHLEWPSHAIVPRAYGVDMTLDALRLEVPDILEEDATPLADLNERLADARRQVYEDGLQQVLDLLLRLNRSAMTLLERQRALQSLSEEYRHYCAPLGQGAAPSPLFVHLCDELAAGFKRLLLQILQGRQPSRPHLAWCLYMAEHFLAQSLLRHYQLYQEPPASLWSDSHLLYWLGEHQQCLDEPVAAPFQPAPAGSLRGLYQQMLLLALSNPFHLAEGECVTLFAALTPLSGLARLLPWDDDEDSEAPLIDLSQALPCLPYDGQVKGSADYLRRLELGALLVALHEPAPLQSAQERELLERVRPHWQGRQQRRHPRADFSADCSLVIGLPAIHAQLLEKRPPSCAAQMLDASPGGARLLCHADLGPQLPVGQLILVLPHSGTPTLALVRWRHLNQEGLHLGLRYLKGLPRAVWLRRAPSAQTHPGVLQSTPEPGAGWHHGLWLPCGQFGEGENLWLQLANVNNQAMLPLPAANLSTPTVVRHPLKLA